MGCNGVILTVMLGLATACAGGVSGALNASFEEGTTAPTGWVLSGGVGTWEKEGHTGSRSISVTGDGKSSNFWKCANAKIEGGRTYRIDFWTKSSPDATDGCVISGTNLCNVDCPHTQEWTHRSLVFKEAPARNGPHFLRLGQWEAKGKVYFDDIRVTEVRPLHAEYDRIPLGDGETVRNGRYEFVAPLKQGLNWARPVRILDAGFNSNRWTFSKGGMIEFSHSVYRRRDRRAVVDNGWGYFPISAAKVEVNVGYHTTGSCIVQASQDGKVFSDLGEINKTGTAEFSLPPQFDGSNGIRIRLVGRQKDKEGNSCDFQVHEYRFTAETAAKEMNLTGATYFVREEPEFSLEGDEWKRQMREWSGPRKALAIPTWVKSVGTPSLGGQNVAEVGVINFSRHLLFQSPVRIVPVVTIDGVKQFGTPFALLYGVKGQDTTTILTAYLAGRVGGHQATFETIDRDTSEVLYTATWDYRVPALYDSGFGYLITSNSTCNLWWAEGPYKINGRCPTPEQHKQALISAAKGEYEPFQVVLAPKRDLKGVTVRVSALQSDRGAKIPAEAVEVCRVGYVNVTTPTDEIGCAGEWPDPLPPCDKPFDLSAKDGVQPLWITIHVPRDAAAGDHRGTIDLAADGWNAAVPFTVHVWNFEIPAENHLKTAFGFSPSSVRRYHNLSSDDEQRRVVDLYLKNFAEHRISPYDLAPFDPIRVRFPENADGSANVDFTRFDKQAEKYLGPEYRFSTFRLPLQGMGGGTFHSRHTGKIGRFEQGSAEYEKIFANYLREIESHLREKGWLDKAYIYWFDEPEPKDFDFVRDGMDRIHRAAPGLRRMLTEEPGKELDGAVDIWCPLTPNLTPEVTARERAKGRELWWYICTGPKGPYCTLFIDHYAIEFRMWSWQTWKTGVQGLLIWQTNYWTSDAAFPAPQVQNPWEDPMSYVSGYSTPTGTKKHWGNGDGRFIYPPNRDPMNDKNKYRAGPVNSIRWEMLREGIEDYEYFWLLRDLVEKAKKRAIVAGEKSDLIERGEKLLSIPDSITRDQTHFTKDPLELYQYREKVARAIETLSDAK
jgi:hypothetical protein